MLQTSPDVLADQLLKRCVGISLLIHLAGVSAMIPLAYTRATPRKHTLSVAILDVQAPITKALTKIEKEKVETHETVQAPRAPRAPRIVTVHRSPSPQRTHRATATKSIAMKPGPATARSRRVAGHVTTRSPEPLPRALPGPPDRLPGSGTSSVARSERDLPRGPEIGPRLAALPPDLAPQPGRRSLAEEMPGGGSMGASLRGKMLPRAPGALPLDPNDSGGAKVAPGGMGPGEQTPMGRGLPIGKKEANLPYNPNITSLGGGRSGMADDLSPGGGPVAPRGRKAETVFLGGGLGGWNLPKARPRIGGGGGAPALLASNSPRATDAVQTGKGGWGPGSGGGIGYGTGTGAGFSRGAGIGLSDGKVPQGVMQPGIGQGIGQGEGSGIGTGGATRPGRGEPGPGTGSGVGYGYGHGDGIGMGTGQGGSKLRPKVIGLPFGEPGGMVGGRGGGGGIAGSGPGGPGFGVRVAGLGRGDGGGGSGGTGAGYGGGVGYGRGGGGAGGVGGGIGSSTGGGYGGGGYGGGGRGGTGTGEGEGVGRPGGGGRRGGGGESAGGGGGSYDGGSRGGGGIPGKARPNPGGGSGTGGAGVMLTRGFLNGGLKGEYYDDPNKEPGDYIVIDKRPAPGQRITWRTFATHKFTRIDRHINFRWNTTEPDELDPRSPEAKDYIRKMRSPGPGVDACYFSVRWTGKFYVPEEGEYTFSLEDVDDGGRLWIDGKLVIDEWFIQKVDSHSRPIHLSKGIHDIRVDYCQGPEWMNSIVLCWRSRSFPKEVMGPAQKVRRK